MLKLVLGVVLVVQLSGPGGALPQILHPDFKASRPIKAGKSGEVTVSFNLLNGYAINHTPPISLKLTATAGVRLKQTDFVTPPKDPKSKDEYYVDLPVIKVPVTAAKAGDYEVPAKLVYFFCSKSDGFCSRQVLDIKIPVKVE
jgi:hypothetical protein